MHDGPVVLAHWAGMENVMEHHSLDGEGTRGRAHAADWLLTVTVIKSEMLPNNDKEAWASLVLTAAGIATVYFPVQTCWNSSLC